MLPMTKPPKKASRTSLWLLLSSSLSAFGMMMIIPGLGYAQSGDDYSQRITAGLWVIIVIALLLGWAALMMGRIFNQSSDVKKRKLIRRAVRLWALAWTLAIGLILGWGVGTIGTKKLRNWIYSDTIAAAQPIIDGIRAFEGKHGHAPRRLTDLMPKFLAEIPPSGFEGKDFTYKREASSIWQLSVAPLIVDDEECSLSFRSSGKYEAEGTQLADWFLNSH